LSPFIFDLKPREKSLSLIRFSDFLGLTFHCGEKKLVNFSIVKAKKKCRWKTLYRQLKSLTSFNNSNNNSETKVFECFSASVGHRSMRFLILDAYLRMWKIFCHVYVFCGLFYLAFVSKIPWGKKIKDSRVFFYIHSQYQQNDFFSL